MVLALQRVVGLVELEWGKEKEKGKEISILLIWVPTM
jgi:hypothetical protein